jgi:xylulose-5-phosphate/fructose-6-phosphate phosphoketolase
MSWSRLSDLDRFHLVIDVIDRVPFLQSKCEPLRQKMLDKRIAAREYTREHGDDPPEVRDWVWPGARGAAVPTNIAATVFTAGDNE